VSDLLIWPWRSAPASGRWGLSTVEGARRIVSAWLRAAPRVADVSSAWLREHEIESAKRGQT
jgi:hypothetical protein